MQFDDEMVRQLREQLARERGPLDEDAFQVALAEIKARFEVPEPRANTIN